MTSYDDCFIIVNGPEDGTSFPVVRAPFYIGGDTSCAVNVRLDPAVKAIHALATVVPEGYRIRRVDTAPVIVDGKKAGMMISRIVHAGGIVQVGQTQLCLHCAPDGLASRSHGIVTENDLTWALRKAGVKLLAIGADFLGFAQRLFGRLLGNWVAMAAVLGVIYVLSPWVRGWVNYYVISLYHYVIRNILQIAGQ